MDFNRLENTAALAPMAGAADSSFRLIAMECGASFCVSEMVTAKALCFHDKKTMRLMEHSPREKPFGIQLFGYDPKDFQEAAKIAETGFSPDFIDINMGCPAPKIACSGAGSSLMGHPQKAADIVKAVKDTVSVPVTVKMRSGLDENNKNAPELSRILEAAGADAVTIHGKSKEQMYRPPVDLNIIKSVSDSVSVPVFGNGDISGFSDVRAMMTATGCRGVMIGRAALGNPFVFSEIKAAMSGQSYAPPALEERLSTLLRQAELTVKQKGEYAALREMRKHAVWYISGIRFAASFRREASSLNTLADLRDLTVRILGMRHT